MMQAEIETFSDNTVCLVFFNPFPEQLKHQTPNSDENVVPQLLY